MNEPSDSTHPSLTGDGPSANQETKLKLIRINGSVPMPNGLASQLVRVDPDSNVDRRRESIDRGRLPVRSNIAMVSSPYLGSRMNPLDVRIWFDTAVPAGLRDRGDVPVNALVWDDGIVLPIADLLDRDAFFRTLLEGSLVVFVEPEELTQVDPAVLQPRWRTYIFSRMQRVRSLSGRVGQLRYIEDLDTSPLPVCKAPMRLVLPTYAAPHPGQRVEVWFNDAIEPRWKSEPMTVSFDELLDYWSFVTAIATRYDMRFRCDEVESATDSEVRDIWRQHVTGLLADARLELRRH